jgi:hypothetical protein
MSKQKPNYEQLLRKAIQDAREAAPRAVEDLLRVASEAADAVEKVTESTAVLEMVPINQGEGATKAYQLQLRKAGSEAPQTDLGVYTTTPAGYPVMRWYSRRGWEDHPDEPDQQYPGLNQLEGDFRRMLSNHESKLVVLLTFFQEQLKKAAGAK